jgi:hypothetical protein
MDGVIGVLKSVLFVVAIGLLLLFFSQVGPLVFPERPWAYALSYGTDGKRVFVAPRPQDCDFLFAPLGFKGCHYEKIVSVTRYRTDVPGGQPTVSSDDGKTWAALPAGQNPGPPEVYVTWNRIEGTR